MGGRRGDDGNVSGLGRCFVLFWLVGCECIVHGDHLIRFGTGGGRGGRGINFIDVKRGDGILNMCLRAGLGLSHERSFPSAPKSCTFTACLGPGRAFELSSFAPRERIRLDHTNPLRESCGSSPLRSLFPPSLQRKNGAPLKC